MSLTSVKRRTLRGAGVAAAIAAALVLSSCGGDTGQGSTPQGSTTGGDDAPAAGASFVWVVPGLPSTTDPVEGGPLPRVIGPERGSLLVQYDLADVAGMGCDALAPIDALRGDLAESWEISEDGTTITFKLREGVTSSFGNQLTAEDVKWSLERSVALSSTSQRFLALTTMWREQDPITIVDDHTVEIHVDTPGSLDVANLTMFSWMIFDSTEAKKHATPDDEWAAEWLQKNSADFGPWAFTEADWQSTQQLSMTRNPNYWAADEYGNVDRLVIKAVPEGSSRAQLVTTGEAQLATDLSAQDVTHIQDAASAQVLNCLSANRDTLVLNQGYEPLADERVRQALSLALDRGQLNQGAYLGLANEPTDGLSQAYDFPRPTDEADRIRYDVDAAKALLAEAGYPDGFQLEVTYSQSRPGPQATQLALNIQSQLGELGIAVTLKEVPSSTQFNSAFLDGQYQAVVYQEPPAIADPQYSATLYNASTSPQNTFGFDDPEYDDLSLRLLETNPGPERDELATQIAALTVRTTPVVYLVDTNTQFVLSTTVDTATIRQQPGNRLELWRAEVDG